MVAGVTYPSDGSCSPPPCACSPPLSAIIWSGQTMARLAIAYRLRKARTPASAALLNSPIFCYVANMGAIVISFAEKSPFPIRPFPSHPPPSPSPTLGVCQPAHIVHWSSEGMFS
ncbi:unnamed protein product [Heligmosomoides polygyrus]|uniref:G_PROTEIN_RECEP_F1_2 domain-containing protein n=1 Tax=Heligmosomoides polygyrus TaxID=6339 RepID=A0A183FE48_HELPZ|nr:unnamed protein product [Heligmosomoides polygyrus]